MAENNVEAQGAPPQRDAPAGRARPRGRRRNERGGRGGNGPDAPRGKAAAADSTCNHHVDPATDQGGGRGSRGGRGGRGARGARGTRGGRHRDTLDLRPKLIDEYDESGSESGNQPEITAQGGGGNQRPRQQLRRGGMSKLGLVRGKNTESFEPVRGPTEMRIVVDPHPEKLSVQIGVRDLLYAPSLFARPGDENLYEQLVREIEHCSVPEHNLLKPWHGDSHLIADDKTGWKRDCPVFNAVVKRLQAYFNMDVKATRFNWYKTTADHKPFHHDAAAVKPDKARTQNYTVAVSFGATREAAFEHVESRCVISLPCPNGSVYCFSRDANILWRHGILQVPPERQREEGRISIILWGWVDQVEAELL